MIHIFNSTRGYFEPFDVVQSDHLPKEAIWLDLEYPTIEEERALEKMLGFELLTADEMRSIEPSSRLFQENGVSYMTATVTWRADTNEPESVPISFIMFGNRLVTMRYSDPRSFIAFKAHMTRQPQPFINGTVILMGLLEAIIDRNAELLERVGSDMDGVSRSIFVPALGVAAKAKRHPTTEQLEDMLVRIAFTQNLISKVRESLVSLGRMVSFFAGCDNECLTKNINDHIVIVTKDVHSLTDHASFLSGTITFLLDSCLGFINIEQNAIIKIFSVASVIFLPPTLVASLYGMNFKFMPELSWEFGYLYAIILMICSAAVPFWFFKKKRWL